jgi:hypothetical protein
MEPVYLLAVIAGLPILLGLVFRVSAVFLFISVISGSLLVQFMGDDAVLAAGMLFKGQSADTATLFALLFLPVIFTMLFMRKTMKKSKVLLHIVPLIGVGLSAAVFALPVFADHIEQQITSNKYGEMLTSTDDVIVGATAVSVLLLMWLTERHKEGKHGKHGK